MQTATIDLSKLRERVEAYFYSDGNACGDCGHCQSEREPHGEVLNACLLIEAEDEGAVLGCPGVDFEEDGE